VRASRSRSPLWWGERRWSWRRACRWWREVRWAGNWRNHQESPSCKPEWCVQISSKLGCHIAKPRRTGSPTADQTDRNAEFLCIQLHRPHLNYISGKFSPGIFNFFRGA
jgi:hypothetical protein